MPSEPEAREQFVVFRLYECEYALPVKNVVEVLRMVAITPVPDMPTWLPGIINLRGRIITILDLRARLGLPAVGINLNAAILVSSGSNGALGLIADSVTDVLTLPPAAIRAAETGASTSHPVSAVARVGDRLIMILDLERLRARQVLSYVESASER